MRTVLASSPPPLGWAGRAPVVLPLSRQFTPGGSEPSTAGAGGTAAPIWLRIRPWAHHALERLGPSSTTFKHEPHGVPGRGTTRVRSPNRWPGYEVLA